MKKIVAEEVSLPRSGTTKKARPALRLVENAEPDGHVAAPDVWSSLSDLNGTIAYLELALAERGLIEVGRFPKLLGELRAAAAHLWMAGNSGFRADVRR